MPDANNDGSAVSGSIPINWNTLQNEGNIGGHYQRLKLKKATLFLSPAVAAADVPVVHVGIAKRKVANANPNVFSRIGAVFKSFNSPVGEHSFGSDATVTLGQFYPTVSTLQNGSDNLVSGVTAGWIPGNPPDDTAWNGFDLSIAIPAASGDKDIAFTYYYSLEFIGDVVNYK